MNHRTMQLLRNLEDATKTFRTAMTEEKNATALQPLGKAIEERAEILARNVKDLVMREYNNPHFHEAQKLAHEGWSATRLGNSSIDSSVVFRNGQRYYLLPADRSFELRLLASEEANNPSELQKINLNCLQYLEILTAEAGDPQFPTLASSV